MSDDTVAVFHALQTGARGSILEGARKADIVRSIRTVFESEVVSGAAVALEVIQHFTRVQTAAEPDKFPKLSEREAQILKLMALELSNDAKPLGLALASRRCATTSPVSAPSSR